MNRTELKELICKGKKLKHKKFGDMKITAFEGNFFYADTKKGNMPFYYEDIGETIEIIDTQKKAIINIEEKVARPIIKKAELKELICKGKKLKHKEYGEMRITSFEGNFFYANTKKGSNMPFYYFEIGDTIEVVDPPKARPVNPAAQKAVRPAAKKAVKAAAKI